MKYLFLILLCYLLLTSCASLNGGTKGKQKYQKVQCPTYPEYTHYVRSDGLKTSNPDTCPLLKRKRKNNLP